MKFCQTAKPRPCGRGFAVYIRVFTVSYSLQRLKTSALLVPPKPNEFDSA